nr:PREDICTED: LOW QUALITY PROTEIN: microtubule-associated protein 6-like [Equus przewalskii]
MAWPCITRACCIARFWNQLDKADIAVPLVFTKYSEDSVMRQDYRAWKVQRPEPSCRPRSEYQPSDAPFERETQYQKDFRAWPLPRRGDHPWIPKPVQIATSSQARPSAPILGAPKRRPQSQERWPMPAAAEAPEQEAAPGRAGVLAAGKASGGDERDTRRKPGPAWMLRRAEGLGPEQIPLPAAQAQVQAAGPEGGPAAEAPEQEAAPGGAGVLAAGKASGGDERDTRRKPGPAWMLRRAEGLGPEQTPLRAAQAQVQAAGPEGGKGRAVADALNRQIREEVTSAVSSSYRNEFRAWTDIKPVKPIKAKPQYKPPDDKMAHETSYSAQFKGEANKPTPADNKVIDRRRIRSLYSEPFKEPPKVEKPSVQSSKPKKTSASHKPPRKAKDKQAASGRASKKKSAEGASAAPPDNKEHSKEMNNKLAEAKE